MHVLLMVLALKPVLSRFSSGIERKTMYPPKKWQMLRARGLGAPLRKNARTTRTKPILSESMTAFGVWPAYQSALHKQLKLTSPIWNSMKKPKERLMKLYPKEVRPHHTLIRSFHQSISPKNFCSFLYLIVD